MTKTHVLKTRLRRLLKAEELKHPGLIAHSIGIAENTLRPLLDDDWQQLGRDTIEKVCDKFGLSINQLFEFEPDTFWEPLVETMSYRLLIGASRIQGKHQPRDAKARAIVTNYLATTFPGIDGQTELDLHDVDKIVGMITNANCIVVGSPRSNIVTDVVFSRHYGTPAEGGARIPYRFVFPIDRHIDSALTERWNDTRGEGPGVGICDQSGEKLVVEVDWWNADSYSRRLIPKALDAALVLVINRPLGTPKNVKTIVLAGFSGLATEAAARALIRDFRDLEPKPTKKEVLGVLEATYKKGPDEDDRVLTGSPRWKALEGGRKTIRWSERREKAEKEEAQT